MEVTTQKNNTAHGDIVAGDKITHYSQPQSYMSSLIDQFEKEILTDKNFSKIIEDLEHFTNAAPFGPIEGLKEKLIKGQRGDSFDQCSWEKETFHKKLMRSTCSIASQKIIAFTLGNIYSRFMTIVRPLINENVQQAQVDKIIQEKIIDHCIQLLEKNPLDFNHLDIRGMIYYLTGNCYIRWD